MRFGSQNAKDATADRERRIEAAADRRVERLNQLDQILNRPIGSKVNATKEEQLTEYEYRLSNPEYTLGEASQRAQAVGPQRAAYELLKYSAEMRKLMEGDDDAAN